MNDGYTKVKNPTASLDLRQEIPILKKIEATMIRVFDTYKPNNLSQTA